MCSKEKCYVTVCLFVVSEYLVWSVEIERAELKN